MSVVKKGEATNFVWGTGDGIATVVGRIISQRVSRTEDQAELANEDGEVDGLVLYNKKTSASIECLLPSSGAVPAEGDSLTVDSHAGIVRTVEKSWSRGDWAKYTITVEGFDLVSP